MTTSLTGRQWLEAVGLALLLPIVIEVSKWIRRRRLGDHVVLDVQHAVSPARAAAGSHP